MADDGPTIAGESPPSARVTTSFLKIGDRTRFTLELRPGETTIVSWKKLMKDVAKAERSSSATPGPVRRGPEPVTNAYPFLESRLAPGKHTADELKDAPPPNRFNAVIEKIERLYMGKDSSDEEDLNGTPDDDQYDTEDSFIDDAELDEYFEVDMAKTKHDGYFVNRGALEKVNDPLQSTNQQPKKRRRKEIAKGAGDNGHSYGPDRPMKVGRKRAGKSALSVEKNILHSSQGPFVKNSEEVKVHSKSNASGTCHQKVAVDAKPLLDLSSSLRIANGDASSSLAESNDKKKTAVMLVENPSSNLRENNAEESERVTQQKYKNTMREKIDLNLPDGKPTMHHAKTSLVHKKEASSLKPKANSLDKAIRELEKMVAELRPPAVDAQDADASSSIKRRLPREIKLKLAKVARLANASNGKVSKELLNRLMGIVGHLCQIRTLKRHLKIMMTTSLSAKQEIDDKFQQIKKEVTDLIKSRFPSLISKGAEQLSGGSGDVQDSVNSDKALKGQHFMDTTLEDKICDLYDIFVDGLDEDAAPQVRKLYAELAELWPRGVMDNHGIKRAICHAKERKKSLNERTKDQEKIKRKKVVATKIEDRLHVESSPLAQLQHVDLRLAADPGIAAVPQQSRFITSTTSFGAATAINPANVASVSMPLPSTNVPNFEQSKHERVKGTVSDGGNADGMVVKKKVKRRKEIPGGGLLISEKLYSHQGDDRQKQDKHDAIAPFLGAPHKSSYNEFRFEPLT